jgi:DNA-binding MarR family transcriptional regulator
MNVRRRIVGGAAVPPTADPIVEVERHEDAWLREERQHFQFDRHRWLAAVARDAEITGADLRVAVLIWEYTNADFGYAWPSMSHMAMEMSLDRSTVVRSVSRLEQRGWIDRTRRHGRFRSNEYRFAFRSTVSEPD